MADPSVIYTLNPPTAASIVFNDFDLYTEQDGYWLNDVQGLEPDLRVPIFNKPVTDGSRVLPGFFTGLTPAFTGEYVVQSTRIPNDIRRIRNTMRRALRAALADCIDADAVLTWIEPVVGDDVNMSLNVRYREKLTTGFESDFAQATFAFSLVSEASAPTES